MKWLVRAESCAGGVLLWTFRTLHEAVDLVEQIEHLKVMAGKVPEYSRISIHQLQDDEDSRDWLRIRINPPMEEHHA